jgi:hypothetical protein
MQDKAWQGNAFGDVRRGRIAYPGVDRGVYILNRYLSNYWRLEKARMIIGLFG